MDIASADGSLWLIGSGIADDIDFTLQLVAVDRAGNESAPQTVRIKDDAVAAAWDAAVAPAWSPW